MADPPVGVGDGSRPRLPPLSGLLVADFSRVLAGPLVTMILGDLGAEVIKVERPEGDETRAWGPPWGAGGLSTYFQSVNRNKRSLVLDLRDADDVELGRRLIGRADVVIENFRPGTMERLGLGEQPMRAANPRLVWCSVTGFGRRGGAALPGYDLLVQALGGLMSVTGEADGPPVKVGVAVVDVIAGLYATVAILAALIERGRSGLGQRADVSLLESLLAGLVNQSSAFAAAGEIPARMGNRHPSITPYASYAVGDGEIVVAVGNDRQFGALCRVLGAAGLALDPRFAANPDRIAHRDELDRLLRPLFLARSRAPLAAELNAAGVPAGAVNDIGDAFAFAAELGLDPIVEMAEGVRQVASPINLEATPVGYRRIPPPLGADDAALREWLRADDRELAGP
jgi:crotonobetainyl-CoA:carnitine CoA-transferase CaiB-like acyl-CoA transferase